MSIIQRETYALSHHLYWSSVQSARSYSPAVCIRYEMKGVYPLSTNKVQL